MRYIYVRDKLLEACLSAGDADGYVQDGPALLELAADTLLECVTGSCRVRAWNLAPLLREKADQERKAIAMAQNLEGGTFEHITIEPCDG